MGTARAGVRSVALATSDLLWAVVGLAILWYPAISLGNALLGEPLADQTVRLLVGVLGLGSSYPFVAGDWSSDTLGDYVIAFVASAVAVGLLGAVVIVVLGLELSGSDQAPQTLAFAAAYLVANLLVHRGGYSAARRAVLHS